MSEYLEILRPYQRKQYDEVKDRFRKGDRGVILQLETGGGKSKIMAAITRSSHELIMKDLKGTEDFSKLTRKVLFLADRGELIKQARQHLIEIGIPKTHIGVIKAPKSGDYPFTPDRPIQVATIQSFNVFLKDWDTWKSVFNFSFIIIDECHKQYGGYKTLKELFPKAFRLGASATPIDRSGKAFDGFYQSIVTGVSRAELIARGYSPKPQYWDVKSKTMDNLDELKQKDGDYDKGELEAALDKAELRGDLVKTWKEKVQAKYGNVPTIGFADSVRNSKSIVAEFSAAGISAVHVDGTMSEKQKLEAFGKFISGEATILYNVAVCVEGFDLATFCKILGLPEISVGCVQLACPTLSLSKAQQMRGRARGIMIDGRLTAIYLDHAGIREKHEDVDFPWEWTLEGFKKKGKRTTRACPENDGGCGAVVDLNAKACPECGYEFLELPAEEKEPSDPLEKTHDKNLELTLVETSNETRFAKIIKQVEASGEANGREINYRWAISQLASYSPDYEEVLAAVKLCKTQSGKAYALSAAFHIWVEGQQLVKGDRWVPSEDEFFEVVEKMIQLKEKPLHAWKAWVSVNQKANPRWEPSSQAWTRMATTAGYSGGWIKREQQLMFGKVAA